MDSTANLLAIKNKNTELARFVSMVFIVLGLNAFIYNDIWIKEISATVGTISLAGTTTSQLLLKRNKKLFEEIDALEKLKNSLQTQIEGFDGKKFRLFAQPYQADVCYTFGETVAKLRKLEKEITPSTDFQTFSPIWIKNDVLQYSAIEGYNSFGKHF